MKKINVFTVKQVKESGALYDLDTKVVKSPQDAHKIIETVLSLSTEACENFGILTLNTKNAVAGVHIISKGSLNASIVHPREVFKSAMLNNAASIIAFHNHPSGDTQPSREDIDMTKRLVDAGKIIGIDVLDHVIIGDAVRYYSLKENGEM